MSLLVYNASMSFVFSIGVMHGAATFFSIPLTFFPIAKSFVPFRMNLDSGPEHLVLFITKMLRNSQEFVPHAQFSLGKSLLCMFVLYCLPLVYVFRLRRTGTILNLYGSPTKNRKFIQHGILWFLSIYPITPRFPTVLSTFGVHPHT